MPKVEFRATGALKSFLYRKARKEMVKHGEKETLKVLPAQELRGGQSVDMDDFEAEWCLVHYPDNFSVVAPKKPTKESDE